MIRLDQAETRSAGHRFALELLVDLARLLRVDDPAADVVSLRVTREVPPSDPLNQSGLAGVFRPAEGVVYVPEWLLDLTIGVAGAGNEQKSSARDRYDRIPSSENPLVAAGLERKPIMSQLAGRLRTAVAEAAADRPVRCVAPWPDGHRWAVGLSHDVDVLALWPAFTALRMVELAKKREWTRCIGTLWGALRSMPGSPALDGVVEVAAMERERGLRSSWFFLCGAPTFRSARRGDITYDLASPAGRRALAVVSQYGECGLHGSFDTMTDADLLRLQRERVQSLSGHPVTGVRQHYLRHRPGITQRAMCNAGFSYDASYGLADRNGFRLGVADIVPGWDAAADGPSGLDEVPLIWMDRALSKYQGVEDPALWIADGLDLAAAARAVDGLWVGLWHPNLIQALGYPGAVESYTALLAALGSLNPYCDTLDRLVRWRRARRGVRASTVIDGAPAALTGSAPWGGVELVLERLDGTTAESLPWPEAT